MSSEIIEGERGRQRLLERLQSAEQDENRRLVSAAVLQRHSPRQREILRLIAQGRTNASIGQELHLSPGTVKNHVTRLLRKLGAADRTHAAARASELGLAPQRDY